MTLTLETVEIEPQDLLYSISLQVAFISHITKSKMLSIIVDETGVSIDSNGHQIYIATRDEMDNSDEFRTSMMLEMFRIRNAYKKQHFEAGEQHFEAGEQLQ